MQIVTDESSNPNYKPVEKHGWIKLEEYDHRETCKPFDKTDLRYTMLVKFISEALADVK